MTEESQATLTVPLRKLRTRGEEYRDVLGKSIERKRENPKTSVQGRVYRE